MVRAALFLLSLVIVTTTSAVAMADINVGAKGSTGATGRSVYTRGYFKSNGTYVAPYYRTRPDSSFYNNWSSYPNLNPYTGEYGTRRYPSYTPSYPSYTPSYRSYTPSYRSYRYDSYDSW